MFCGDVQLGHSGWRRLELLVLPDSRGLQFLGKSLWILRVLRRCLFGLCVLGFRGRNLLSLGRSRVFHSRSLVLYKWFQTIGIYRGVHRVSW